MYLVNYSKLNTILKITPVPGSQIPLLAVSLGSQWHKLSSSKFYKAYQALTPFVSVTGSRGPFLIELYTLSDVLNVSGSQSKLLNGRKPLGLDKHFYCIWLLNPYCEVGLLLLDFILFHSKCWAKNESLSKQQQQNKTPYHPHTPKVQPLGERDNMV